MNPRHRAYIVGAYAASPALREWNPDLEREFFDGLLAIGSLRGLELPWIGGLHLHDEAWLLENLAASWDIVLTDVAGTARKVAGDPAYGLASRDEVGRAAALADAELMRQDVHRLADAAGRANVIAVELHSAPRASAGDRVALERSLSDLAGRDWAGASLVIEHCDAEVPGHEPAKGYLSLEDEIAVARATGVGISLNWGRSAIELREADRVVEQVREARSSGLLQGFILSGAAAEAGAFGAAWEDAHLPFARSARFESGDPHSLLTLDRAAAAIAAAGDLPWQGIKFGWADAASPTADRVAMISNALAVLDRLSADTSKTDNTDSDNTEETVNVR